MLFYVALPNELISQWEMLESNQLPTAYKAISVLLNAF